MAESNSNKKADFVKAKQSETNSTTSFLSITSSTASTASIEYQKTNRQKQTPAIEDDLLEESSYASIPSSVQFFSNASLSDIVLKKDAQTSTESFLYRISEDTSSSIEEDEILDEQPKISVEKRRVRIAENEILDEPARISVEKRKVRIAEDEILDEPARISVEKRKVRIAEDEILDEPARVSAEAPQVHITEDKISDEPARISAEAPKVHIAEDEVLDEPARISAEEPKVEEQILPSDNIRTPAKVTRRVPESFEIVRSDESLEEIKQRSIRFTFSDIEESGGDQISPAQTNTATHNDDNKENDNSNLESGHAFVYMIIPPDGGYGWFITLMSFLCQVVVDGITFSIGTLLPQIALEFDAPGSEVVLIAAIQIGCYFLFGAFASSFINKYGFRPVGVVGAILSATVLTIASCSTSLMMMILFYSVLGGPVLSMIWVSSQLIIGYYFDEYRPIANGISCSGAGIGIMSFCYMNSLLLPLLGWRNVMRVHVGFLLLVVIITFTFIEVTPTRIGIVRENFRIEDSDSDLTEWYTGQTVYSRYSMRINNQEYELDENFESALEQSRFFKDDSKKDSCLQKWCPCIHRYLPCQDHKKSMEEDTKGYYIKRDIIEKQDMFYAGPQDYPNDEKNVDDMLYKLTSTKLLALPTEGSQWRTISLESFDNKYIKQTILTTLSNMKYDVKDSSEKKYRLTYAELKLTKKRPLLAFVSPQNWLHPKIMKPIILLFDFRLLLIREFQFLLLSAFLFPMGFNIPFVYSTVRVHLDPAYARLITPTIGFSNFAFRVASGLIAYKYRAYTCYICGGCMFLGGFAVFVSAFYGLDVIWFQFLYAFVYGMAPASYSTLRAIIYVQTLGLDKLTNAFGLSSLAMGLGVFIGTTAAGVLNDFTGSYTAAFAFAGICICSAGSIKLYMPWLTKYLKANAKK